MRERRFTWKSGLCLVLVAGVSILSMTAVASACEGDTKRMKTIISPLTGKAYAVLEMADGRTVLFDMADKEMKRVSKDTWGLVNQSGSVKKAADAYKGSLSPEDDFKMDFSEPEDRGATKENFAIKESKGVQAAPGMK